jgi:tRNA_anti-like
MTEEPTTAVVQLESSLYEDLPMRRSIATLVIVVAGFASLLCGCGKGGDASSVRVQDLYDEFSKDAAAAKQKYAGKTVRVQVDKLLEAPKALDKGKMLISGTVGKVVVWAIVPGDGPDGDKAKALKPGDRVAVEGQITGFDITDAGTGLLNLDPARIAP